MYVKTRVLLPPKDDLFGVLETSLPQLKEKFVPSRRIYKNCPLALPAGGRNGCISEIEILCIPT